MDKYYKVQTGLSTLIGGGLRSVNTWSALGQPRAAGLDFFFQAWRGGVEQLIRPAIAAVVIERRVAKAHAGLFMAEVNTPEAAVGQVLGPGKGQPVLSGPKFI
jgi:hypothetical protein